MEAAIIGGSRVVSIDLSGYCILIVEDEPLITMEIAAALEAARATVCTAARLEQALRLAERPALALAIIDLALGSDISIALCNRLAERSVPFLIYTGYSDIPPECKPHAVLRKPADRETILRAVAALI
jgi:DNA-binding NarL/FixJ family response regulator